MTTLAKLQIEEKFAAWCVQAVGFSFGFFLLLGILPAGRISSSDWVNENRFLFGKSRSQL